MTLPLLAEAVETVSASPSISLSLASTTMLMATSSVVVAVLDNAMGESLTGLTVTATLAETVNPPTSMSV